MFDCDVVCSIKERSMCCHFCNFVNNCYDPCPITYFVHNQDFTLLGKCSKLVEFVKEAENAKTEEGGE